MIRTGEDLQRQKEALLRKHPDLGALRTVTVPEAGWDHRRTSDFIESCWRGYYGAEEARVVFSPEFLEWQFPELEGLCVLDRDGRPAGCALTVQRFYGREGGADRESFTFGSCLSILPEARGRGIAQWLVLALQESDLEKGRAFACSYVDGRKAGAGSAFRIWGIPRSRTHSLTPVSLFGKTFDWRKARQYGRLNLLMTAVVRGAQQLFPSRRGHAFAGGRRVQEGGRAQLPAVRELLAAVDRSLPLRRVYGDDELARMIAFRKNAFHALSYLLLDAEGRADGLLAGYKFPLGERACTFFADGLHFRPGLSYRLKRAFLAECEGRIRELEGCIGATLLSTASRENLLKHGYIPYDRQLLLTDRYSGTEIPPGHLRGLRIELR